ncbi:MAG TPA: hypothetical protein DCZ88_03495 [Pseudanabaena sp.]|nr:hypothetical protein [Pseudanabaena sp.]
MLDIQERKTNHQNLHNQAKQLTCIYRNESSVIQIVRISQPSIAFFERTVLPNQYIHFSTSIDALLEVYEGVMSGLVHADTIPCYQLAFTADSDKSLSHLNSKIHHELSKTSQGILTKVA